MNYSYITLLTNDSYIYGLITLLYSYKNSKSRYPMAVICLPNISKENREIISDYFGCTIIDEEQIIPSWATSEYGYIDPSGAGCYHTCMAKLHIFKYTQFDKLVYVDADMVFTHNVDELFNYPHMSAVVDPGFKPNWHDNKWFNAGLLVVKPNMSEYEILLKNIECLPKNECADDQKVLYLTYPKWPDFDNLHLPYKYNFMVYYYNNSNSNHLFNLFDISILHMTGGYSDKPWRNNNLDYFTSKGGIWFNAVMFIYAQMINNVISKLQEVGFGKSLVKINMQYKLVP